MNITNIAVRGYIYRVLVAISGLLLVYGITNESEIAAWLFVASQALNLGGNALASRNTPTSQDGNNVL